MSWPLTGLQSWVSSLVQEGIGTLVRLCVVKVSGKGGPRLHSMKAEDPELSSIRGLSLGSRATRVLSGVGVGRSLPAAPRAHLS